jgi:hypothetical protein
MSITPEQIEQWKAQKFEGLSKLELKEAGKLLGAVFAPNQSEANMRKRLNAVVEVNGTTEIKDSDNVIPIQRKKMAGRPKLNATDLWEGMRYTVEVSPNAANSGHKNFMLTWDGVARAFPYKKKIDMPFPYYNVLKTSEDRQVKQRKIKDEDGNLEQMECYVVSTPRFSFQDYGVTPGTENLPNSMLDYWQGKALKNDFFKDIVSVEDGRKVLIQCHMDITEPHNPDYYRDQTNVDILNSCLRLLGFEDEIYNTAEAMLK